MLIATRAVLRGINAGSATADGDAIDRNSGIVILSEGLAFDGWDELWMAPGNLGGLNRRLDYWNGQVNLGCHSTRSAILAWRAELPKKGKEIPAESSAQMRFSSPSSSFFQQLIPTTIKTTNKQGDSQNASA